MPNSQLTKERWLEEGLRATEPLISNGDDLTVRQLIALLQGRRGCSSAHFLLKVQCNIAELLLNVTHDLTLSCMKRFTMCQRIFIRPN